MRRTTLKALSVATMLALAAVALANPAEAGRRGWGPGFVGAGLIGLGVGAAIGSALASPVYVAPPPPYYAPPPPPPPYYAPVAYGPPPWTPEWYSYCASRFRSFDARTGYYMGYDGVPHFCQ